MIANQRVIRPAVIQALEPRLLLAAQLLADINSSSAPSNASDVLNVNGTIFFSA